MASARHPDVVSHARLAAALAALQERRWEVGPDDHHGEAWTVFAPFRDGDVLGRGRTAVHAIEDAVRRNGGAS